MRSLHAYPHRWGILICALAVLLYPVPVEAQPYIYIMSTVVGGGDLGDGGQATSAWLYSAAGVAVDSQGNVYIADPQNHRIRKVGTDNTIQTVAGTGVSGLAGDGGPATQARLYYPKGVAVDSQDNLFIADTGNHRIRKVSKLTGTITTVAGSTMGFADGPLLSAQMNAPEGVAVDTAGIIYVADTGNNRVRQVDPANGVNTVTSGVLKPRGVAVRNATAKAIVYVADTLNNRVLRITVPTGQSTGAITTVLGGGSGSLFPLTSTKTATAVSIPPPVGVAVNSAGLVYVAISEGCEGFLVAVDDAANTVDRVVG